MAEYQKIEYRIGKDGKVTETVLKALFIGDISLLLIWGIQGASSTPRRVP